MGNPKVTSGVITLKDQGGGVWGSVPPNGPGTVYFQDDFQGATDLDSLLISNGGKWESYDSSNDPIQISVQQYPPNASKKSVMIQYIDSGDQDVLRTPSLGLTEAFFEFTEFHSSTYDAGPTKDLRWFDPVTGIDLYATISNPANTPGVVSPVSIISFNVQGNNFVPGGSQGDPNVYYSVPFTWSTSQAYKITFYIKLNTQGNSDGELRLYVDDVLLHTEPNLKISDDSVSNYTLKDFQLGMVASNYGNPFDGITERYITDVIVSSEKT